MVFPRRIPEKREVTLKAVGSFGILFVFRIFYSVDGWGGGEEGSNKFPLIARARPPSCPAEMAWKGAELGSEPVVLWLRFDISHS